MIVTMTMSMSHTWKDKTLSLQVNNENQILNPIIYTHFKDELIANKNSLLSSIYFKLGYLQYS